LNYSCPEGWIRSPNGCFYFAIDVEPTSWNEAVVYCKEIGGYLAEVMNAKTQRLLVEQATALGDSTNWWLGATDQKSVRFSILVSFYQLYKAKFYGMIKPTKEEYLPSQ
jgi:hypothetical protein